MINREIDTTHRGIMEDVQNVKPQIIKNPCLRNPRSNVKGETVLPHPNRQLISNITCPLG